MRWRDYYYSFATSNWYSDIIIIYKLDNGFQIKKENIQVVSSWVCQLPNDYIQSDMHQLPPYQTQSEPHPLLKWAISLTNKKILCVYTYIHTHEIVYVKWYALLQWGTGHVLCFVLMQKVCIVVYLYITRVVIAALRCGFSFITSIEVIIFLSYVFGLMLIMTT